MRKNLISEVGVRRYSFGIAILFLLMSGNVSAGGGKPPVEIINPHQYSIEPVATPQFAGKPKNIILFIGDGMGIPHVTAALTANGGNLYLNYMKHIGLMTTHSADNYVTDSAAGGTAIATGQKVPNGHLAMDAEGNKIPTFLQISSKNGKATGMVATSSITHATPASFISHQSSRLDYNDIALDFLKTDIDLFIGGGLNDFANRNDQRNLINELKDRDFLVYTSLMDALSAERTPLAVLTHPGHNPRRSIRGDILPKSVQLAIDLLSKADDGFFLMVEGSQIDWAGHENDMPFLIGEMLDLDIAIGKALKFAAENKETLVIVTADHETGGVALVDGCYEHGFIKAVFARDNHSGEMVPVFAYGPGAEMFLGMYDNTDLFRKMMDLFGF